MSTPRFTPSDTSSWRNLVTPARLYALTRIGLGLWIFLAPNAFGHKWFAAPQDPLLTGLLVRQVGGRDFGIGLGLLTGRSPRAWLWLCAFCDLLDAGLVYAGRSKFSDSEVMAGVIGAGSYGLIAIAIAVFGRK